MKDFPDRPAVEFHVDQDQETGCLQLSICRPNRIGYRLAGPEYIGSSINIITYRVNERDASEIRKYLDESWPISN